MNNRFKFRVWSIKHKQWLNHCAVIDCEGQVGSHYFSVSEDESGKKDVREHLSGIASDVIITQQFIGLKDKNGKDIFEGDIVNFTRKFELGDAEKDRGEVSWCSDLGVWQFDDLGTTLFDGDMNIKTFEVIGNIIENPELLKNE